MVSEREYYRTKCVYLLPEKWWGSKQRPLYTSSNRTAQRVPDNAGLVTPNSNKGTDKQLQQLHAFTKQLHFRPDNNWVK